MFCFSLKKPADKLNECGGLLWIVVDIVLPTSFSYFIYNHSSTKKRKMFLRSIMFDAMHNIMSHISLKCFELFCVLLSAITKFRWLCVFALEAVTVTIFGRL